ncbi:MAG: S49 family peptidase [Rickettsiales bacterium]|nr:S49 family peptidase [Rickettsiales bacterium]
MMKKLIKSMGKLCSIICKKKQVIAVIRLKGIISSDFGRLKSSGINFETVKKDVDRAFGLSGIKAVVVLINSPGGSPVQAELIHKYIKNISEEKKIPVYGFIEDVAASGGYWLACISNEIYASENSIIGSIGVIVSGFGFTNAIKKLGIERRIITQGKNKSIYDPFLPVKKADEKIIQSVQKDIYESFKKHVIAHRGNKLGKNKEKLFNGEFWSGKMAVKLGLVDGIGNFYEVMKEKYGKDTEYKFIEKEESWFGRKLKGMVNGSYFIDEVITQIKERVETEKFF